jgi:hypothetical protein
MVCGCAEFSINVVALDPSHFSLSRRENSQMHLWAFEYGNIIHMFETEKRRGQFPFPNLQALTPSDMNRAVFPQTLTESIE